MAKGKATADLALGFGDGSLRLSGKTLEGEIRATPIEEEWAVPGCQMFLSRRNSSRELK